MYGWQYMHYLKLTIIRRYIFRLKHVLRVLNFVICTRIWYRVDKF